jgi:hypothetical protein
MATRPDFWVPYHSDFGRIEYFNENGPPASPIATGNSESLGNSGVSLWFRCKEPLPFL